MKNANGSGSVYKLHGKRRKPWICVFTTSYSRDGKQIRKSIGTFATKKEAQIALADYNKNPFLITNYSFINVYEQLKATYSTQWSEKTLKNYEKMMRRLELFHTRRINDISLYEWQSFLTSLDLSYNYKRNFKWLISSIYGFAERYNLIQSNKIKLLDVGKKEVVLERKIFTKEEIDSLFTLVEPTDNINMPACLCVLIYTGLRAGELLALKKEDVNLQERWLKVQKSKTFAGERIIPIHKRIIPILEILMDTGYKEYVITSSSSLKEIGYNSLRRCFSKFKIKYNLDHTIHDTRHTFATMLNNANANSTSIKKLIGHSNFELTEDVYIHKSLEDLKKAIDSM